MVGSRSKTLQIHISEYDVCIFTINPFKMKNKYVEETIREIKEENEVLGISVLPPEEDDEDDEDDPFFVDRLLKVKDLALATTLVVLDFTPHSYKKIDEKTVIVLFQDTGKLRNACNRFWSNDLLVDPLVFSQSMKTLKHRIYNEIAGVI